MLRCVCKKDISQRKMFVFLFGIARESEKRVKAFYHDLDKKIELEIGLEPTTY